MALKIVEAHLPPELAGAAEEAVREDAQQVWQEEGGRFGTVVCAVAGAERTGRILDRLHERFGSSGRLLVLVRPLDAVLPRPFASAAESRAEAHSAAAVSREEVYAGVADTARLDGVFIALVVAASVVAGIGLALGNTAAVIGAMVVAPLLGPTMALALGFVLGELALVRRALVANATGLAVALTAALLLGLALDVDPDIPELASRTRVSLWDLVLALAAGTAGALSYTTGVPSYLTGVMVAVALLPPAVASGLLAASGRVEGALSALVLSATNVTALTLAAMLTFLVRGMRPRNWWQEERAKRSTRVGLGVFATLVALLALLILLAMGCGEPEPPGPLTVIARLADDQVKGLATGEVLAERKIRTGTRAGVCAGVGRGLAVEVAPGAEQVTFSTGVPDPRTGFVRFAVYEGHAAVPLLRTEPQRELDGWVDHVVALPPSENARTLRLETTGRAGPRAEACFGSFSFLGRQLASGDRTPAGRAPNVVLVSLDTLGAGYLGSFGHPAAPSPRIDAFLDSAFSFRRAYVQFGNTLVSHRSIFTSHYPSRQRDELPVLAEILADAGYLTLAVTEDAYVGSVFGFARGFDRFDDGKRRSDNRIVSRSDFTFEKADAWLDALGTDTRFFLFLHTYQVHAPYRPTRPEAVALADGLTPGDTRTFGPEQVSTGFVAHNTGRRAMPEDDLRRLAALHTGEVLELDALVGAFLDGLAARGLERDTLVILTSDHGEAFGEDGVAGHGQSLHGSILHVPLAFRWPGSLAIGASDAVVQSVDLMPSLLSLVGLPLPDEHDGRDLSPLLRGDASALEPAPAFAEVQPRDLVGSDFRGSVPCAGGGYGVTTERWKLVRCLEPESERLFDLAADPAETLDVAAAHPNERARLSGWIDAYRTEALRPVPLGAPTDGLDEETREQLRALGYLP